MARQTGRMVIFCALAWVIADLGHARMVHAGEWTQWGGPNRDFRCSTKGLASSWSEGGPKKIWSRDLGDGYSAIIADENSLYTMYSIREKTGKDKYSLEGQEVVVALDARTGKTRWEHKYDAPWYKGMAMEFGPGPHSTPLLVKGRLITVGVTGLMFCLDAATGKVVWKHDLATEYKLKHGDGDRGYGASPLQYQDTVILPVGGKGKGVVAFKLDDGTEAWKGGDFEMTYASIFPIKLDNEEQLVVFGPEFVMGMRPGSAEIIWKISHTTTFGANISTPVWDEKNRRLFISSAYGMGSRGIELEHKDGATMAKELWYNKKMKIHFGNAVRIGELVYGSSGDMAACQLCGVDMKTGEFAWQQKGLGKATVLAVGKKLLALTEDGTLVLAQVSKDGFEELSRADVCGKNAWTVPTLVGSRLYIRDRKSIIALDLGQSSDS